MGNVNFSILTPEKGQKAYLNPDFSSGKASGINGFLTV